VRNNHHIRAIALPQREPLSCEERINTPSPSPFPRPVHDTYLIPFHPRLIQPPSTYTLGSTQTDIGAATQPHQPAALARGHARRALLHGSDTTSKSTFSRLIFASGAGALASHGGSGRILSPAFTAPTRLHPLVSRSVALWFSVHLAWFGPV
jgi:hypothetical protein